ncbi:antibiotic biosynthesis monooxygenase [Streptomyces sp. NPDC046862]|uniref:antibiotic biosynthesis monooxygenase n=1 Tax=Streptomyces sp. NPDC046862 TaxID=3154603 RepID=UPI003454BD84
MSRPREDTTTLDRAEDQGVTLVYSWEVKPGRQEEFEELTHEIAYIAEGFCGHEGVTWLRPQHGQRVYHGVLRFADQDRLDAWLRLPARQTWLDRVHGVAHQVTEAQQQPTGMETWFSLPQRRVKAPPRWKMTLVTMLGAFPVALAINALITPHATALPVPLKAALFPLIAAPVLTYVIMPGLSRLFRRWLYEERVVR